MPNPFEKDWTQPKGHETEEQPPSRKQQGDVVSRADCEPINLGNSGSLVFKQIELSHAIMFGHYHPLRVEVIPGNYQWNDGTGVRNYPRISEENDDLPKPDQVVGE